MEIEYLTVKEFAAKLRVDPSTIRRGILSGRIQAFKVGMGIKAAYRISITEFTRIAEFDLKKVIDEEVEKRVKEELEKRSK